MKIVIAVSLLAFAGCSSPNPLPQEKTAYQVYSSLGYHDKNIAGEFYSRGKSDEIKSLYWLQRKAQETGPTADEPKVNHKYLAIPVPEHVDKATGTVVEESTHVVEVVQLVEAVKSHGRTLNIVK